MDLLRIAEVEALGGLSLGLTFTDGRVVERDVSGLLVGPLFDSIASDRAQFEAVRAEAGTVVWPNGADLCPGVLIWGGMPPAGASGRVSA